MKMKTLNYIAVVCCYFLLKNTECNRTGFCGPNRCCKDFRMVNSNCQACEAGTHGWNCSLPCKDGNYGPSCKKRCSCRPCNKVTGMCENETTLPEITNKLYNSTHGNKDSTSQYSTATTEKSAIEEIESFIKDRLWMIIGITCLGVLLSCGCIGILLCYNICKRKDSRKSLIREPLVTEQAAPAPTVTSIRYVTDVEHVSYQPTSQTTLNTNHTEERPQACWSAKPQATRQIEPRDRYSVVKKKNFTEDERFSTFDDVFDEDEFDSDDHTEEYTNTMLNAPMLSFTAPQSDESHTDKDRPTRDHVNKCEGSYDCIWKKQ